MHAGLCSVQFHRLVDGTTLLEGLETNPGINTLMHALTDILSWGHDGEWVLSDYWLAISVGYGTNK